MKATKLLMAVFCLAVLVLAGCNAVAGNDLDKVDLSQCDNTVKKCWKITETASYMGYSASANTYVWGTEYDVVSILKGSGNAGGYGASVTTRYSATTIATEEACEEKAREEEKKNSDMYD